MKYHYQNPTGHPDCGHLEAIPAYQLIFTPEHVTTLGINKWIKAEKLKAENGFHGIAQAESIPTNVPSLSLLEKILM